MFRYQNCLVVLFYHFQSFRKQTGGPWLNGRSAEMVEPEVKKERQLLHDYLLTHSGISSIMRAFLQVGEEAIFGHLLKKIKMQNQEM